MNWLSIQRIVGLLLMMFSVSMLTPIIITLIYEDGNWSSFLYSFLLTFFAGIITWFPSRNSIKDLKLRDGFVVVAMFWIVLGSFGAAPFYYSAVPDMSLTDSIFESMSGLTTTGATVITGLDFLPKSILFYRQQLQWLGGMGIIVLAVAILPMLGVGGMQLYRAETPGPIKDNKLTPRITETAKALWYVYLTFTAICATCYFMAGMSGFDAITHSFSTIAIGGFSTHDASMGYFNSNSIELISIFFMFAAGINFSLHFFAWQNKSFSHYILDQEFKAYLKIIIGLSLFVIASLYYFQHQNQNNFITGLFHTVSIATTTGFTTSDFSGWPGALPMILVLTSFVGGSAGSTAGGIKVIRSLLIYKQGIREIKRLIHPNAEIPVKIGKEAISHRVVDAVWGFFSVYLIVFAFMLIAMMMVGLDYISSFSAVAATLNNLGPGLGEISSGFSNVPESAKWIAVVGMLLGRLEIFTLLVLITPAFWRH